MLQKRLPERKSLTCPPVWLVPNTGRFGLGSAVSWNQTGGGSSLFSCPVSSLLLLWPQKPFWSSSLPSPACSGGGWPGLIFMPPLDWSWECFCSPFRQWGLRWPMGPIGSGRHHDGPLRHGRSEHPALPACHPRPPQLPWVPLSTAPLPCFGSCPGQKQPPRAAHLPSPTCSPCICA